MKTIKVQMEDMEPKSDPSITKYCRKLLNSGESPDTRLEVYRGDMLCLSTSNIGETAKWMIKQDPYLCYVPYKEFPEKLRSSVRRKRVNSTYTLDH